MPATLAPRLLLRRETKTLRRLPSQLRSYSAPVGGGNQNGGSKVARAAASAAVLSATAYTLGSLYPPALAEFISPRIAPPAPAEDSKEGLAYTLNLEAELQALSLLQELRLKPDANEWYETRPYQHYPEEKRVNSLTAGALRGPGKLALTPLARVKKDESESVIFLHFGRGVCGHDGIIHGGLLATVMDESLGRIALLNLPSKVGVTATLTINYRAPVKADQFVVVRTKLESVNGRKVQVSGRMEDLNGNLFADATALFVEPKYAKLLLKNTAISKALGTPEPEGPPIVADVKDAGGSV